MFDMETCVNLEMQRLQEAPSQRSFSEEHAWYVESISALVAMLLQACTALHLCRNLVFLVATVQCRGCSKAASRAEKQRRKKIFHEDCHPSILPDLPIRQRSSPRSTLLECQRDLGIQPNHLFSQGRKLDRQWGEVTSYDKGRETVSWGPSSNSGLLPTTMPCT